MKTFLKRKNTSKTNNKSSVTTDGGDRVTNNTVHEHRDEVLKKGRQFKYPFQRSKHRIVAISLTLVLLSIVLLSALTGFQLYKKQSSNIFTYRVTQILPFPVAKVDGKYTSYESYLFELRNSIHWLEKYGTTDLRSPDGIRQIDYMKRQALDKAQTNTIAQTFAKQHNISVSKEDVDQSVERAKSFGGDFDSIIRDQYGFGEAEFRRYKRDILLREKVAQQLDTDAPKRATAALAKIQSGVSFADVAKELSEDEETKQLGGEFGVVRRGHTKLGEVVEEQIFSIAAGQTSPVITTSGDYYIIQVIERPDETQAKIAIIRIKIKTLNDYLGEYRTAGKIKEFITLTNVTSQ